MTVREALQLLEQVEDKDLDIGFMYKDYKDKYSFYNFVRMFKMTYDIVQLKEEPTDPDNNKPAYYFT